MPRKKNTLKLTGPSKATSKTIKSPPLPSEYSDVESKRTVEALELNRKQMMEMQNRILSAPAMNGGFSTLMYKIEKIEQGQDQLVEKVDDIRVVLYDPDSGLYARIKSVENTKADEEAVKSLENSMNELHHWKESKNDCCTEGSESLEALERKIFEQENSIKEIKSWHDRQAAVTKWLAVTIGTMLVGTIGKFIYDLLISHVKLV